MFTRRKDWHLTPRGEALPHALEVRKAGEEISCADDGPNFCHTDLSQSPDFKAALTDGLRSVAGQIISCNYALPVAPPGEILDRDNIKRLLYDSREFDRNARQARPERELHRGLAAHE